MERKFLEGLGLDKEAINSIMAEHGKTVQAAKPTDYDDLKSAKENLEKQIAELNGTLQATNDKYADYEKNVETLTKEMNTYKNKSLKMSIASRAGLPLDLAERLSGETEEEIKADAEKLAGFVAKPTPLPMKTYEEPTEDSSTLALKQTLNELKGE